MLSEAIYGYSATFPLKDRLFFFEEGRPRGIPDIKGSGKIILNIPLSLQHNPSLPIDIDRFALDFLDIDVLLQVWRSYDQDPEAPFEQGDIGNGNYGLRGMIRCS